jgi:hypothetical protein
MEDFSAVAPRDRNLARRAFLGPGDPGQRLYGVSDAEEFARNAAQRLRATAARYPDAPEISGLVGELLAGSEEFRQLWDAHDVAVEPTLRKTFQHPLVGPVALNCDALDIADRDQQLVIYTAEPGSSAEEALRLLAVVGTQRMDAPR